MVATMLLKANLVLIVLVLGAYASKFGPLTANLGVRNPSKDKALKWPMVEDAFKGIVDSFLSKHLGEIFTLSRKLNISSRCRSTITEAVFAIRKMEEWPLRMADASGKIAGGLLEGTILNFGSFSECLGIRVNHDNGEENFRGRYCMVGYRSPLLSPVNQKTPDGQSYVDAYGNPPKWIHNLITKTGPYLAHVALWFGTCVPSTCSEADVKQICSSVSKPMKFEVKIAGCKIDEPQIWSRSAFIAVFILCFILSLCVLGTILDVVIRHLSEKAQGYQFNYVLLRILRAFSLYSNTEKLFGNFNENDTLGCFHGIRFFSAVWIILGHTYFFTDTWKYTKYRDALTIDHYFNYYLPAAVLENFTIPVGSFFFMSGFLLVFSTWKKLERSNGRLNLFMFIVHKYWRMTPALGLMIAAFLALPLIGSGPLWDSTLNPPIKACEAHWWTNLLYINNWFGSEDYCLIHTWYLAALMQFHIIGVIILLLCFRWPAIGTCFGIVIAVVSCTLTALLIIWNNFPMPTPAINKDLEGMADYNTKIYTKPFCHVPTYLIGMVVAHIILKYKDKHIRVRYQILGWLLAILGALSSVYGIYAPSERVGVRAFYLSCYRIGWTMSIGWLAFACITNRGGVINRLLSWNAFVPLGQLSYLVYLLHPLIMLYKTASLRERISYGHNELVFEFLTYTVIAFFLAYIGHVAVEKPFLTLEGIFFKSRPSTISKKTKDPDSNFGVKTVDP